MVKDALSPDQLQAFERDGYLFPLTAMLPENAARYLVKLDAVQTEHGVRAPSMVRSKAYLVLTWVNELIRLEAVLDAVESIRPRHRLPVGVVLRQAP